MKNFFLSISALLLLLSCGNRASLADKPLPQPAPATRTEAPKKIAVTDKEVEELKALRERITQVSERVICKDPTEWRAAPAGAKACGGPSFYVAYHRSVELEMRDLIEEYTIKQDAYNRMHGIVSDCMLVAPPSGIKCEEGKAVLVKSTGPAATIY